jgi:hypothetical protein
LFESCKSIIFHVKPVKHGGILSTTLNRDALSHHSRRPMVDSKIDVRVLAGLSLAEAFAKYVLNDPSVLLSSAAVLRKDNSYEDIFREGRYPGPYVEYTWPLNLTAKELSYLFVKSLIMILDRPSRVIPKEILDVSELLVARIKRLQDHLISGRIIARGTFAASGIAGEVDKLQWERSDVLIDVRNSDLLEDGRIKPLVKWSGLTLSCPPFGATIMKPRTNLKSAAERRDNAHRASIKAAIASLWPEGIPPGLSPQKRDGKIIEWQKENERQITDARTIRRHFGGK